MKSSERRREAPETMHPPETSEVTASPAPSVLVMDKFRGRRDLGMRPYRPGPLVKVKVRHGVGQVNVGRPVGVDCADIAPVTWLIVAGSNAGLAEPVRNRAAVLHHVGNDVFAEIMAGIWIGRVALQFVEQKLRIENVDAHAGERNIRFAWHRRGIGRLLEERVDDAIVIDMHDAEGTRLLARHLETAHGNVGFGLDMLLEHDLVVHLVDVVAGENNDEAAGMSVR